MLTGFTPNHEDDDSQNAEASERHGLIESCCRLFTDIQPGEGRTGVLMFFYIMLVLIAFYMLKPLREGWITQENILGFSKWEIKAYSSFGQSILLVGVVAIYDRLVNRLSRGELISRTTFFCMALVASFWVLQPGLFFSHIPGVGIFFYLCVGMFGGFMVAQSWTFAVDLYNDERGRRMLPMIAIGASIGALIGSYVVEKVYALPWVRKEYLLLLVLMPLACTIPLALYVNGRHQREGPGHAPAVPKVVPTDGRAFNLVFGNHFLLLIALITLLLNWVNTNGENLLFRVISEVLDQEALSRGLIDPEVKSRFLKDGMTAFYGNFFFWVNAFALILQAFVASRLLKYGGFALVILLMPILVFTASIAMTILPVLALIKTMKIAENATDYSINNTARHVLWLPMNLEVKFKAKPAIDSLFARLGDGFAAMTVFLGSNVFAISNRSLFAFNAVLVLVWLAGTVIVVREHRRMTDRRQFDNEEPELRQLL